ncbi:methyl-accepting chemotaxis protein [Catenovulum agarivorans]|uniref:methyl-accepting chemotaxis protein n=1 Tax=Catenovulum agarivorans TaxID=1172192 RepID=UPI0012FA3533|nr:methyl-accepting chemotaxis protein [Catenovulum agarivorans]
MTMFWLASVVKFKDGRCGMRILNRFKIKTRMIALSLVPLIVTFMFASERLNQAFSQQDKIKELEIVLEYGHVTYPYISALLNEAYYSRQYIDNTDPQVQNSLRQMQTYNQKAVKAQKAYVEFIELNRQKLREFTVLSEQINQVTALINSLVYVRKGAAAKSHTHKESGIETHVMWQFNLTARQLVLTLNEIAVISSQNEVLSRMSNAYFNLVSALAETSFHNAYVYTSITKQIDAYIFGEVFRGATSVSRSIELFNSFASDEAKSAFLNMVNHPDYKTWEEVALQVRSDIYQNVNKKVLLKQEVDWNQINNSVINLYDQTMAKVLAQIIDTKELLVADAQNKVVQTIAMMAFLLILIGVFSFIVTNSIVKPLKSMVNTFSQLASKKNMSTRLDQTGQDELAELSKAFNVLIASFNTTLLGVQAESNNIRKATQAVNSSMADTSGLLGSQQSSTDSISVAINEMTTTIEEVANMATLTSDSVQKTFELSVSSAESAEKSKIVMENLTREVGNTSLLIERLNQDSDQIGSVLNVIQGIAEQTNLLALNAAIEAARAGEQGRGFAVVADEVRNLASRTRESTEQIHQQIETLQKGAISATQSMNNLQLEGENAVKSVIKSVEAFETMKTELDAVTQMAVQIATAAEEQSSVSSEINQRILTIKDDSDKITLQTTNTVDTARDIDDTGKRLNQLIHEFKL